MSTNSNGIPYKRINHYPDILTVVEMCQLLGVSTKTGYRILRSGEVISIKIGRSYRIPKNHVLAYLKVANKPTLNPVPSLPKRVSP